MKSQRNWDFAQKYSAKLMMISGLILFLFSLSGWFYNPGSGYDLIIGMILLLLTVIILLTLSQAALKSFEKDQK